MSCLSSRLIAGLTAWGAMAFCCGCGTDIPPPAAVQPASGKVASQVPSKVPVSSSTPRAQLNATPLPTIPALDSTSGGDESPPRPEPQKIYRPDDSRPERDVEMAARLGIHRYESKRLVLYSDIDPAVAEKLPSLIDQAYDSWVDYFGELPPNRAGTDYQVTGYVISDLDRFAQAGMLPPDQLLFRFGRHVGAEFWMYNQSSDYYRRHLLIHEATHCFMTTMPGLLPPMWYLEGMAEFFATHRLAPDGTVEFHVMPQQDELFPGLGRINLIQQERQAGRLASLQQIGNYTSRDFLTPVPVPYAWSWAVCIFLDRHPRYRERFRKLGQHLEGTAFQRKMVEFFEPDRALLSAEWEQFARRLVYAYDFEGNAFRPASQKRNFSDGRPVTIDVAADAGWQSTGIWLQAHQQYAITATGEVILDDQPRPWVSKPQGISIEYAAGVPVGTLQAGVLPEGAPAESQSSFPVWEVGTEQTIESPTSGELWLRVNDHAARLADNIGHYQVQVRIPRDATSKSK